MDYTDAYRRHGLDYPIIIGRSRTVLMGNILHPPLDAELVLTSRESRPRFQEPFADWPTPISAHTCEDSP
jgi:hypothetical protein